MKKEYFLIFLILLIEIFPRIFSLFTEQDFEVLKYTAIAQDILLIIYCAFLIGTERRPYITVLLSLLLIGFIGQIMDIYRLTVGTQLASIADISHFLLIFQLVVDNLKKKDKYLLILGFAMALTMLTRFILSLAFEAREYIYVLNFIVLIFGLLLIRREVNKELIVESYLKILTLQYILGSVYSLFYLIKY